MTQNLNGTRWKCIDESMVEFNMTATVVDGEISPDSNGENDIEIQYQNGKTAFMKLRPFQSSFKRISPPPPRKCKTIH